MATEYDPHRDPIWKAFSKEVATDLLIKALVGVTPEVLAVHPGFPLDLHQPFDLVVGGYQHYFQYRIQYFSPSAEWRAPNWKAYGSTPFALSATNAGLIHAFVLEMRFPGAPEYLIGCVEIDALIYRDPGPLRERLTTHVLALELMSKAVANNRFVRVAFQVHPIINAQNQLVGEELMLARSSLPVRNARLDQVVEEYRRLVVPPRSCTFPDCGKLLPVVGPGYCLGHIITPPG
ncbi:hypothetical protein K438DRAFT_2083077 [Mycena galopus ATCC 62051]|nr:hypothetical protein K438DRAFT_2083077 [Mycena galopus ATCC 62051]